MTDERRFTIGVFLRGRREQQVAFLDELVCLPSDNPAGECASRTRRVAELLEPLGFDVERCLVPSSVCRKNGMVSATTLVVRQRRRRDQERITTVRRAIRFVNSRKHGIRSLGLYRILASPRMYAADPPTRILETV